MSSLTELAEHMWDEYEVDQTACSQKATPGPAHSVGCGQLATGILMTGRGSCKMSPAPQHVQS